MHPRHSIRAKAARALAPRLLALSLLPLTAVAPLSGIGQSAAAGGEAEGPGGPHFGFSLTVLSRGRGVPEAGAQALRRIRALLEGYQRDGVPVRTRESRIGLEGERRLCADFDQRDAAEVAWRRAEEIVAGLDLVNLKAGPCSG